MQFQHIQAVYHNIIDIHQIRVGTINPMRFSRHGGKIRLVVQKHYYNIKTDSSKKAPTIYLEKSAHI